MDTAQIVIIASVTVLTAVLTLVGFEVFLLFREFRHAVRRVNKILEDAGCVSEVFSRQISSVGDMVGAFKTALEIGRIFFKHESSHKNGEKKEDLAERLEEIGETVTSPVRRFFHRSGKRLS